MPQVYDELIDFIAAGSTAADVASFQPSEEARARAFELISNEKDGTITPEEQSELDHFMQLEHVMRLAKARVRQSVSFGL